MIESSRASDDKYLLYIDILGFRELVTSNPSAVRRLYKTIDALNAHKHQSFYTVVFSDTILVCNLFEPRSAKDHEYAVMYSCEFAHDLLHRVAGRDIFFRAVLEYGEFLHYDLQNIKCFFGRSLVAAYDREKTLPAIGLFITAACNVHNRIFPTAPFADDLSFVFLNQCFENLQSNTGGRLPSDPIFDLTDDYGDILPDLAFLRSLLHNSRHHPSPQVRSKHLATYDLYCRRYPELMLQFELADFQPEIISPSFDWSSYKRVFAENRDTED